MKIGYAISSHVIQLHITMPILLQSMDECGIDRDCIAVIVNGSNIEHEFKCRGVRYFFRQPESQHHIYYIAKDRIGQKMGVSHWFFVNGTSRCGPNFKKLVESGFEEDAPVTIATNQFMPQIEGIGARPCNDLAMYQDQFLVSVESKLAPMLCAGMKAVWEHEGLAAALGSPQAQWKHPIGFSIEGPTDVYGTGTPRKTEYFPHLDWYRYKKNWGQLEPGTFKASAL